VAQEVWRRFGPVKQYIEPFCGTAAVLLANPEPPLLEVVNDMNGYIANFWRAVKNQPAAVADWADYPVSHIDLGARHRWLTDPDRTRALAGALQDPEWPGDAQIAGWWVWGQCCWIGSGWCDWFRAGKIPHASDAGRGVQAAGQIPHASDAGRGVQAAGKIPHASDAGRGVQAAGQIPHASDAGMGVQAAGQIPHASNAGRGVQAAGQIPHASDAGMGVHLWLAALSARLARVRVTHGDWHRCLNHHYGKDRTAVFLDPPYKGFAKLYGAENISDAVERWARDNAGLRVAICGHAGDYELPGWDPFAWKRGSTYGSSKTSDQEVIWFSPACERTSENEVSA
jgi:hypothetical protein